MKAITRVYKDLLEFQENPLEGLAICMPDEANPLKLRANIQLLGGIYKDVLLHVEITIPQNYPFKAPQMKILGGQGFSGKYHHHVYERDGGYTICIDLLDHGFFSTQARTGWVPEYTLSTLLLQMQSFFAYNHDSHATENDIKELFEKVKAFTCEIKVTDGGLKTHSYNSPFPEFAKIQLNANEVLNDKKPIPKSNIRCHITKASPEDENQMFGFPLHLNTFSKNNLSPVCEFLSFEGFMTITSNSKVNKKNQTYKLTCLDDDKPFNMWMPLYINENHYQKFNKHYQKTFASLLNVEEYFVNGNGLLKIFKSLFRNSIVQLNRKIYSYKLEGVCHIFRLFFRLIEEYPSILDEIDRKILRIIAKHTMDSNRKLKVSEFIELMVLLPFSNVVKEPSVLFVNMIKKMFHESIIKTATKEDVVNSLFIRALFEYNKQEYRQFLIAYNFSKFFLKEKTLLFKTLDESLMDTEIMKKFEALLKSNNEINNFSNFLEGLGLKNDEELINSLANEIFLKISNKSGFPEIDNTEIDIFDGVSLQGLFD